MPMNAQRGTFIFASAIALLGVAACSGDVQQTSTTPTTRSTTTPTTATATASPTPTTAAQVPGVSRVGTYRQAPELVLEPGASPEQRLAQVTDIVEVSGRHTRWLSIDGIDSHVWLAPSRRMAYQESLVAMLLVAIEAGDADVELTARPKMSTYVADQVFADYDVPRVRARRPLSTWAADWLSRATKAQAKAARVLDGDYADLELAGAGDPSLRLDCEGTRAVAMKRDLRWLARATADVRELEIEGVPDGAPHRCRSTGIDVRLPQRASLDQAWQSARSYPGRRLDVDFVWPGATVSIDGLSKPETQVAVARMLVDQGYRVSYGAAPDLTIEPDDLAALRAAPGLLAPYGRVIPRGELYDVQLPRMSIMGHQDTQPEAVAVISRLRGCHVDLRYLDNVYNTQELTLSSAGKQPSAAVRCAVRRLARGRWVGDEVKRLQITWLGRGSEFSGSIRVTPQGHATVVRVDDYTDSRRSLSQVLAQTWRQAFR